jgi:hypothetical protein
MFQRRLLRGVMLAMGLALLVALLPSLVLAEQGNPPTVLMSAPLGTGRSRGIHSLST